MYPPHEVNDDGVCLKTFTFTYKPSNLCTYDAFTHDVKSLLNENPRWHPRWHPMLNG
jgi:hypothetical protein